ncbi:hypothetical protein C9374_004870 [Naegleria lovaniensis]|uniref:Uncharacterized protein n=1 Tax=Naegleria lovaniensis TaxID=51637 RepID=A0AA88GRP1_NAELO|nr:uncharacterized protein C9374_004870 [Naegleria lovaniensis]KAG2382903.1 hypothetical protein C9374_004870 [Naegleria lovaniensis]
MNWSRHLLLLCVMLVFAIHVNGRFPSLLTDTLTLNPFAQHARHWFHSITNPTKAKSSLTTNASSPSCCLPSTFYYKGSTMQQSQEGGKSVSFFSADLVIHSDLDKKLFRIDTISPDMKTFPPSVTQMLLTHNETTYNYVNTSAGCWCFKVNMNPWAPYCVQQPYQRSVQLLDNIPMDIYGQEIVQRDMGNYEKIEIWTIPIAKQHSSEPFGMKSNQENGPLCWVISQQLLAHSDSQNITETYSNNNYGFSTRVNYNVFKPAPNCPAFQDCGH